MTTDESALLTAIRANPADDAPRLVYADWLEENGEPERAEFIRVQCELASFKCDGGDCGHLGAYCEPCYKAISLRSRELELLKANGNKWLPKVHDIAWIANRVVLCSGLVVSVTFAHGFVSSVSAPMGMLCGERCLVCNGSGMRRTPSMRFTSGCIPCLGRGRTPGVLAAIMQSRCAAIEQVTASDKRPWVSTLNDGSHKYILYSDKHASPEDDPASDIQTCIFDLLEGSKLPDLWVDYNSEADAMDALSRAMLKYGAKACER